MDIIVLLSAYNGEKYLREQIDSILNQEDVDLKLLVRDDGSTDQTSAILSEYEKKDNRVVFINKEKISNLGIQKSFMYLLDYAYKTYDIPYFSFADQDDVWLKNKLRKALDQLENINIENNPAGIMYYSNRIFVDENLELIEKEKINVYDDLIELFWKSHAAGCTMVIDRKLARNTLKVQNHSVLIHDSWIYRVAKSIGAKIIFDPDSYILYRQHGSNTVGLKSLYQYQYHDSYFYWIKRFIPMLFEKRQHSLLDAMKNIFDGYFSDLTPDAKDIIQNFLVYRTSIKAKCKLITNPDIKKRCIKDRIIWVYRILFNWL